MPTAAEPWTVLADVLLQCEALICRLAEGRPPRDFAGLFVGQEDLDRVLATLPGLDGPEPERVAAVRARVRTEVERGRKDFADSLAGPSAFAALVRSARLGRAEAEALALLAAVELAPARQRLVAYVQDSVQLPQVTLATLARIFPGSGATQVAPDSRLRRAELVEVSATGPWATRTCALPARVAWQLNGDRSADPELPPGASRRLTDHSGTPAGGLLLVTGADRESRLRAVDERWPGRGRLLCAVPGNGAEWAATVREATLGDLVVVLDLAAPLDATGRDAVARADHLAWALCSRPELPLESVPPLPWQEVRVASGEADDGDWQRALGRAPDPAYRLDRDQLRLVAAAVAAGDGGLGPAVRRLAGGHLDGVAVRVRPRRTWDDLIVPPDDARQLRELAARHRGREVVYGRWRFPPLPSTGTVALFAGPSGTGKTLAAEVVAGELGLDLYKVDLSAVVSKYIGETEKNLERIFGAAAAGDLVLFFDEADALFGKRSEVSDAHDRYANIEVAYLLQRLETYDGLVVLATNLQRNIDHAFLRRISTAVDFVLPEEEQRRAIWARAFPPTAPVADLDLDFLARQFKVSGGVIHNAALSAAFLAAEDGSPITMRHVALSLKREFQKLGRLRTEVEFERYFDLVNRDADAAPAR
ncbi:ATP-binding protein [Phytohabitans sp. LJ34]|uniref:ATP-binding protein n=1 Tax=Phytohabitans sp. LJ34 TaxID=3452217 RepID=UPI003F8C7616